MRFIRLAAAADRPAVGVAELAARSEIDLLQLDYRRPRRVPVGSQAQAPEFAPGFIGTLAALQSAMFLEADFCIVTSAGWSNAMHCVEEAAGVLCRSGGEDVPISAVRGANVLPILDFLVASRVDLSHAVTGRPFRELKSPIAAADLEIGAGPFALALAEGARLLVAGCYCGAAPAIAMARERHGWEWSEYDKLAGAAAAARGASWPAGMDVIVDEGAGKRTPRLRPMVAEVESAGAFLLTGPAASEPGAEKVFERWIASDAGPSGKFHAADVHGQLAGLRVELAGKDRLAVTGAAGAGPSDRWRLDVYYQRGFTAAMLLEVASIDGIRPPESLAEALEATLLAAARPGDVIDIERLQSQRDPGEAPRWLSVAVHAATQGACAAIVDAGLAFAARYHAQLQLVGSSPKVLVDYEVWPAWVPRDAVDLAVDTRPAKEWR
ncbi:MAG: acyclic terpene utilization AtuA family protein [Pirellulales bacterium]|nr:acyclic terpene utilization AtuA family protein [Pirellulales bacterium]